MRFLTAILVAILVSTSATIVAQAVVLNPGDILVTERSLQDSVVRVDPASGAVEEVALVGSSIADVVVTQDGRVFVSTRTRYGAVWEINPETGTRTMLVDSSAGFLYTDYIVADLDDNLIVSTVIWGSSGLEHAIARVDPDSGDFEVLSAGGMLGDRGLAIEADGSILTVGNAGLIRVDPSSGGQQRLASHSTGYFSAVAVEATGNILYSDFGTLMRYDVGTDDSGVVAELGSSPSVFDLAVEADGQILASGFYSRLMRIDPDSGDVADLAEVLDILKLGIVPVTEPITVDIDIKPGSCPNSWNRKSNGVLPVAILGTEDFDVTEIDVSSVTINRADGTGGSAAPNEGPPGPHSVFEDVGTPFQGEECDCHEEEGDGIVDLSMKFKTRDVVDLLLVDDPSGALVPLVVSGTLLDGTPFTSRSDCARLVPPGSSSNRVTVNSIPGAWTDATPLDNSLEGGGFGSFQRTYPHTTVLTLSAPYTHNNYLFVGWELDGRELVKGRTTTLVVNNAEHHAKAVFKKAGCGLGFEVAFVLPVLICLRGRRRRTRA